MNYVITNNLGETCEVPHYVTQYFDAHPNAIDGLWNFFVHTNGEITAEYQCGVGADVQVEKITTDQEIMIIVYTD